ncbi:MAG: P-loop NTPase [Arsenophonus sp. NC-CH8-MAG3]
MFNKIKIPVLGIVENMSLHICSNCEHSKPIFALWAQRLLKNTSFKLLDNGHPLHISLYENLDQGQPTVIRDPNGKFATIYRVK